MADDSNKTNWNTTLLSVVLTAVVSIGGSYFMYRGNADKADASSFQTFQTTQIEVTNGLRADLERVNSRMDLAQRQIQELRAEVDLTKKERDTFAFDNAKLRMKLSFLADEARFIEDLPFAAGIKVKGEDGLFYGYTLNKDFTRIFGLRAEEFIGFTDYDIFPKELADKYQAGDNFVIDTGEDFREYIDIPGSSGEMINAEYIKFLMTLPSGVEAVGFIILSASDES